LRAFLLPFEKGAGFRIMVVRQVQRIDSVDPGKWMTTAFTKTPEGFLAGRAIVTSVGIFTYRNADGSVTKELRLPTEVFHPDSLASMKGKPLCNEHPADMVNADNAKLLQIGNLGSNPSNWVDQYADFEGNTQRGSQYTDGFHVAIDMTVTDGAAIADVESGKQSLSMGYTCEFEEAEPGATWCGMAYDGIQRKIRYNHCAIVDAARAGDAARIRMDSANGNANAFQITNIRNSPENHEEDLMKKITIDGVEYQGDETLCVKYAEERKRANAAEAGLTAAKTDKDATFSKLEAERDVLKDRADKAEAALKMAKDNALDEKRIDEAVNAKIVLLDAASRASVEIKDGMSAMDIKKAVVMAISPGVKLDGKDDVYITVRFDMAVEDLNNRVDAAARQAGGGMLPQAPAQERTDSASAYQRMVAGMKARSRSQEVK
jgi:hypothetical protein